MKSLIIIITLTALMTNTYCQTSAVKGYNIDVTVKGLENNVVYLAYHFGNRQYIQDSVMLDSSGEGNFSGDISLDEGVYILAFPDTRYIEFLISGNQHFALSCEKSDPLNSIKFQNSPDNSTFADFQKRWAELHMKSSSLRARYSSNREISDSTRAIGDAIALNEKEMKSYINRVISENEGSFVATLLKAMLPVEVPEFNISAVITNPDSLRWLMTYNYNKDHYFDNCDLSDERLLRSPLYHGKLEHFFTEVVLQFPDSLIKSIDKVLALAEGSNKTWQYVSVFLFNHFRESSIMGHDAVVVKLADDIYLSGKADWASAEFIENLKKDVDRIRPSLIGNNAINLTMETLKHGIVSLQNIESDFLILYFWEPDCGHCKTATPLLHEFYLKYKDKGVEIFSICTQPDKEAWEKYITSNGLSWINGWDPDRLTHYDFFYNITATPTIFILNSEKKIIAKKLPAESVEAFIENYRKYGR
jgi:thiol-disulfide isomerase/thioredoxin